MLSPGLRRNWNGLRALHPVEKVGRESRGRAFKTLKWWKDASFQDGARLVKGLVPVAVSAVAQNVNSPSGFGVLIKRLSSAR